MSIIEIVLLSIGLATDAFAVSVCKGLSMKKINYSHSVIIALFFGVFQALMPLMGYLLGTTFENRITSIDHWIAFFLLMYIGSKMIYESIYEEDEGKLDCGQLELKELIMLSVATSIDALAVGITFSFYEETSIVRDVSIIGIITFFICFGGVIVGNKFGSRYKKKAEFFGGLILDILAVRILLTALI